MQQHNDALSVGYLNGEPAIPLGVPAIAIETQTLALAFPNGVIITVGSDDLSTLRRELKRVNMTAEQTSGWSDAQRINRAETISRIRRAIESASYECLNTFGIRHIGGHRFEVISERFTPWPDPIEPKLTAGLTAAA